MARSKDGSQGGRTGKLGAGVVGLSLSSRGRMRRKQSRRCCDRAANRQRSHS
jgi:hypothetical protein